MSVNTPSVNTTSKNRVGPLARPGAVVAGVAAAVAVWAIARTVVADLYQPGFGDAAPQELGVVMVVVASLAGGLAAWGLLAVLERVTARAPMIWLALCTAALMASLGGPFGGEGISAGNRAALALLHVAVAVVVLPLLLRTSHARRTADHGESPGGTA